MAPQPRLAGAEMTMRRSCWRETTLLAMLALAIGCGGSYDTSGKGGASGQAGGAAGGGQVAGAGGGGPAGAGGGGGGAAGAGGGPSCTVSPILGRCSSTPTAEGSYRCSETSIDLSTSCPAMGSMTWT